MSVAYPTKQGGTIFASDSDSISSDIDVNELPIGTRVWNEDVQAYFSLKLSSDDLVPDNILEVKGIDGARWIIDGDPWLQSVTKTMKTAVPDLTSFRELSLNVFPANIPGGGNVWVSSDGSQEGGALTPVTGKFCAFSNMSLFQAPKTVPWAFAARGTLITSTAGHFNFIGLANAGGTTLFGVATYSTGDATHYLIYTLTGATEIYDDATLVCDDDIHDFVVTFDLTTMKLFIDGNQVASLTDLSGLSDAASFFGMFNSINPEVVGNRAAIGFIAP